VSIATNATPAPAAAAAAWAALAPQVTVQSVTINSAPVVRFTVKDAAGNPVIGLGNKSQSATASVAGLTNIAFTLAKLVPSTSAVVTSGTTTTTISTEPSKWVSYLVTSVPTVAQKAGTIAASASCDSATAPTWCGAFPSTDAQGTLVDNGDGTYQYTFKRDVTQAKAIVASLIDSADGLAKKADLGDLTYDAALTHRLGIQIGGAAPGTGSNTPNAVTNAAYPTVNMVNTANAVYDFRPDGTAVTNTRDIVKIDSCSSCHDGKVLAHGSRKDPRYCMTCHTDQIKYTFSAEASKASAYVLNGTTRPTTAILDGRAIGNYPNMIHKTHMGKELVMSGYNFNASAEGKYNEVTYPQPVTNCVKCHDGSATAVNKTTNGDNWKNIPSLLACGACHDGINFTDGTGVTLADKAKDVAAGNPVGTTQSGHIGKAKADNTTCGLCHDATTTPVDHVTVDATGANGRGGYPLNTALNIPTNGFASGQGPSIPLASQLGNLPVGVYKINFEIKQVTFAGASGAKKATVVYRILKDDGKGGAMAPVTLNATGFLIDNVDGTPDIYVAYALPQDGLAAPADWNATVSAHVIDIRDGKTPAGAGNTAHLQTVPDANGWYTATLGNVIPDAAKMVTAAVGINYNGFVQLGLAAYPKGIRLREPAFVMKQADGFTGTSARRTIVNNAKCNSCHGQLGVSPSFHSGARNNGEGCAICHSANNATGHTGAANSFGGGWNVGIKNFVHSLHSSAKRAQAFTYEATAANPNGFQEVTYPGVLKDCQQCHVPGSYDFSASANAAALPNLLWTTDAKTDMSNPTLLPSIGLSPWVNILGKGQINYTADNLVTSPVTSACFGCHDSTTAVAHMRLNGGTIYGLTSTVSTGGARPAVGTATGFSFSNGEACVVCHGAGKAYDISSVHQ
jgi:OmcA/MtrC family decaheme c-type cytochrome